MGVTIRIMVEDDLDDVVRCLGQPDHYNNRLQRQSRGEGEQWILWDRVEAVGGVYLWLAEPSDAVIRRHLPGVPLINNLIVRPEKRNNGFGTALLRQAEVRAVDLGYSQVVLGVEVENADARRLYERHGYAEWPHGVITSSWIATDDKGEESVVSEETVVLVKDL